MRIKTFALVWIGCLLLMVAGCSSSTTSSSSFTLASSSWTSGGTIPDANAHDSVSGGLNKSPQLTWTNVPSGTSYFAIKMIDGSSTSFRHWLVINIPSSTTTLTEGGALPSGAFATNNDFTSGNTTGYGGPAPPTGQTHTYTITIYALSSAATLSASSTNANFDTQVSTNLGTATYSGTYTGK